MKEIGTTYWLTPNTGATNEVGFNGRAAGLRYFLTGGFFFSKDRLEIWESTPDPNGVDAYMMDLSYANTILIVNNVNNRKTGYSLRPLKDATITYSWSNSNLYR